MIFNWLLNVHPTVMTTNNKLNVAEMKPGAAATVLQLAGRLT